MQPGIRSCKLCGRNNGAHSSAEKICDNMSQMPDFMDSVAQHGGVAGSGASSRRPRSFKTHLPSWKWKQSTLGHIFAAQAVNGAWQLATIQRRHVLNFRRAFAKTLQASPPCRHHDPMRWVNFDAVKPVSRGFTVRQNTFHKTQKFLKLGLLRARGFGTKEPQAGCQSALIV